jgi:peptide chain release factor 2
VDDDDACRRTGCGRVSSGETGAAVCIVVEERRAAVRARERDAGGGRVTWIDVATDFPAQLRDLRTTLDSVLGVSDVPGMEKQVAELSEQAAAPDLWDDPDRAQAVTSKLSHVQAELERLSRARQRLDDLEVLVELAEAENDADALAEAERELEGLSTTLAELEVRTLLSGDYDDREALVTIRSEAGGVDAADFAEMLLRMYLRWSERHGYKTEVYDTSYAEEAGIKSATFKVDAPYAYGTLSVEQGTHRLVRISPFDNQGRRQTSFAGVEVLPVVAETDHIDIPENDVRVDVYRSSGPGGQSVNTTDSAVRLTHIPTGIVVTCQNEKSQLQNKAAAMRVLQAKLLERARQERQAELDALKGDGGSSWGNQMRSYVLHPYQMVKDLRTEYETGNPAAVFDGEIDEFLEQGIRWRRATDKVGA